MQLNMIYSSFGFLAFSPELESQSSWYISNKIYAMGIFMHYVIYKRTGKEL